MQKRAIFSPPRSLLLHSVGIDLSDRSIKYVEINNTSKGLRLGKYGRESVPPGIIDGGKIVNIDELRKVIKSLRSKTSTTYVRMALPEEQVYLFSLRIPKVSSAEAQTTIELSLEEHIPIPAESAVFDYECIADGTEFMDFIVVASSHEIIDSYLSVFEETGFTLLSFELEAQSVARALISKKEVGVSMVVDIGETRTGLCVVENGNVVLASTIDIGGANLTALIEKKLGVSKEAAEKWKREFGLEVHDEAPQLPETIMGSIGALRDEINKMYVYWHSHKDENMEKRGKITTIHLCGGEAGLPGLSEYLTSSLGVSVVLGNPWTNITDMESYIPEITHKDSLAYATAIGLALADKEFNSKK